MDILSGNNLQDFCRTCLRNLRTAQFVPTSIGGNLNEYPQLLKLVSMLTSLEGFAENITFPRYLCQMCYDKLMDIGNFQKVVIQSTDFISKILSKELDTLSAVVEKEEEEEEDTQSQQEICNEIENDNILVSPKIKHEVPIEEEEKQDSADDPLLLELEPLVKQEVSVQEKSVVESEPLVQLDMSDEEEKEQADDGDDADDEEHSLCSGVANNSSNTSTSLHRTKKGLKCPNCDKYVYKQVYLDAHIRAVHEGVEKPFLCHACEKAFTRYYQLREHISSMHELKKKIICTFQGCNTSFQSKNSLLDHLKVIHAIQNGLQEMLNFEETAFNTDDDKYTCFKCSKQYTSKRGLSDHLKRHDPNKPHKCEVCGVEKVTRTELRIHMRRHEPNAEKFQCSMCPQQFTHRSGISRHVRVVHMGERVHACSYCPKKFGTKNTRICHERLHRGERPFSCEICSKRFIQIDNLKSHMKTHDLNLRDFVCPYCERRFITRKNLKVHEQRHFGKKPHICSTCNRGFALPEELLKHSDTHKENSDNSIQTN